MPARTGESGGADATNEAAESQPTCRNNGVTCHVAVSDGAPCFRTARTEDPRLAPLSKAGLPVIYLKTRTLLEVTALVTLGGKEFALRAIELFPSIRGGTRRRFQGTAKPIRKGVSLAQTLSIYFRTDT
jgi:hypothetical protein